MSNYRSSNRPSIKRVQLPVGRKVPIVNIKSIQSVIKPSKSSSKPNIIRYKPVNKKLNQHSEYVVNVRISPPPPPIKSISIPSKSVVRFEQKHKKISVIKPHNSKYFIHNRRIINSKDSERLVRYKEAIDALHGVGNGRVLIIVACGPSILEIPLEKLKDNPKVDMMCINKPDMRVWPTKYWSFCDQSQYSRNKELWDNYKGMIINSSSVRSRHRNQIVIRNLSGVGFSRDLLKGYFVGRSSTYASLQVALWMNYSAIIVVGLDMCAVGNKMWHYGNNPDVTNNARGARFSKEAESYEYAANNLSTEDRKRIFIASNYNPFSFVEKFNKIDHRAVVDFCNKYKT